jgi:hypothetical protein
VIVVFRKIKNIVNESSRPVKCVSRLSDHTVQTSNIKQDGRHVYIDGKQVGAEVDNDGKPLASPPTAYPPTASPSFRSVFSSWWTKLWS